MGNLFSRFKIGSRIFFGFLVVLFLLVAVAGVGILASQVGTGAFATFNHVVVDTLRITNIDRNIAAMRRDIISYSHTGDERAVARVREIQTFLTGELSGETDERRSEELSANLAFMHELFTRYSGNFDKLIGLRTRRDKLVDDILAPMGLQMSGDLFQIVEEAMYVDNFKEMALASYALQSLMQARLSAVGYLASPDTKLADIVRSQVFIFINSAWDLKHRLNSKDHVETIEKIAEQAPKYLEAFMELVGLVQEIEVLVNETMTEDAEEFSNITASTVALQTMAMDDKMAASKNEMTSASNLGKIIALIALVIGLFFAFVIARGITGPIKAMTDSMQKLAAGNNYVDIPSENAKDEIGEMAKAVAIFKQNAIEVERLQVEQSQSQTRLEKERKKAMLELVESFEMSVRGIVHIVSSSATELQAQAESLANVASGTMRQSQAVASAAEIASSNVSTVAVASEELGSSIGEIGRQVMASADVSRSAVKEAEKVNAMVRGLADSAVKIDQVVNLINDIASQTNLLALNATIEAARAGDAGKGFAVVAGEVKNLANQTARATGEISSQVAAVQAATRDAVDSIKGIGLTINKLNEIGSAIACAVEEQGAATREIARNVEQAAGGTQDVSRNISGVTESSTETGRAASQLLEAARELSVQSENLREDVDKFIAYVRNSNS